MGIDDGKDIIILLLPLIGMTAEESQAAMCRIVESELDTLDIGRMVDVWLTMQDSAGGQYIVDYLAKYRAVRLGVIDG